MSLKVVPICSPSLQADPVKFMRTLADDIESGTVPNYAKAVLVVLGEDGGWRLWNFGAGCKGDVEVLGLLNMGQVILTDKMLSE